MEKMSRVEKYAELRKSIETDNNIDKHMQSQDAKEKEETLKKFDYSIFKKVDVQTNEEYTPTREKKEDSSLEQSLVDDTFTNEYLDDFIKEVRAYNIRKGNRETDNTQADILYQLNAANRAKRTHYIQEIEDVKEEQAEEERKTVLSQDEIALQVQNLLREENMQEEEAEEEIIQEETSADEVMDDLANIETKESSPIQDEQQPVKKIIQPVVLDEDEQPEQVQQTDTMHKQLLEETQQLRVQMDEYEDELTELSDGVEKTNKLLNVLLCFLILVLLVIIGGIIYTIWNAGGI
ncbi:MAG: hypothetical protein U0N20_12435 [Clostridium sp.]